MAESAMYISKGELQAALKELDKVADRFADFEWRKKVLSDSARIVEVASQQQQKQSAAAHYYYRNSKKGEEDQEERPQTTG